MFLPKKSENLLGNKQNIEDSALNKKCVKYSVIIIIIKFYSISSKYTFNLINSACKFEHGR